MRKPTPAVTTYHVSSAEHGRDPGTVKAPDAEAKPEPKKQQPQPKKKK